MKGLIALKVVTKVEIPIYQGSRQVLQNFSPDSLEFINLISGSKTTGPFSTYPFQKTILRPTFVDRLSL